MSAQALNNQIHILNGYVAQLGAPPRDPSDRQRIERDALTAVAFAFREVHSLITVMTSGMSVNQIEFYSKQFESERREKAILEELEVVKNQNKEMWMLLRELQEHSPQAQQKEVSDGHATRI